MTDLESREATTPRARVAIGSLSHRHGDYLMPTAQALARLGAKADAQWMLTELPRRASKRLDKNGFPAGGRGQYLYAAEDIELVRSFAIHALLPLSCAVRAVAAIRRGRVKV